MLGGFFYLGRVAGRQEERQQCLKAGNMTVFIEISVPRGWPEEVPVVACSGILWLPGGSAG